HSVASEGGAAEGVAPPRPVEEVGHDASPRARRGMTAGKRTSKQAESEVRASIAQVKALTQRYRGARSKKGKRMVYKAGTKKGSAKKSGRGIRFYESDLWRRPQPSPEVRQAAAGPIRLEEVMENAIPVE